MRTTTWITSLAAGAVLFALMMGCSQGSAQNATGSSSGGSYGSSGSGSNTPGYLVSLSPGSAFAGTTDVQVVLTLSQSLTGHSVRHPEWLVGRTVTDLPVTSSDSTHLTVSLPNDLTRQPVNAYIYVAYGDVRDDSLAKSNFKPFTVMPHPQDSPKAAGTQSTTGGGSSKDESSVVSGFVRIDVPAARLTRPNDVNNDGIIVGRFDDAAGVHGFMYDHGSVTTIDVPGASLTVALGINDLRQVVGRFMRSGVEHCFLLTDGAFIVYDHPGAVATQCHGITLDGRIVGRYLNWENPGQGGGGGRQHEHGFLLSSGGFVSIDYPDAATTDAWKINADGVVVGDWSTNATANGSIHSGAVHGYVFDGGVFTPVDVPGMLTTTVRKLNARGLSTGFCADDAFVEHGFVHVGSRYTVFDVPGAVWTDANALNDAGLVVGSYQDSQGTEHGFVANIT